MVFDTNTIAKTVVENIVRQEIEMMVRAEFDKHRAAVKEAIFEAVHAQCDSGRIFKAVDEAFTGLTVNLRPFRLAPSGKKAAILDDDEEID